MIVEVNGIKMEVDERTATTIDHYKVGDSVKVLVKEYSSYKSYHGVIVGFDAFTNRPTIVVAYFKRDYSAADVIFAYIHKDSEDIEITPAGNDMPRIERNSVMDIMNREILKKEMEVADLRAKRDFFENRFNQYFA